MRWVVYGAGAVGGVVGARLREAGHDVVLIARGPHAEAMRRSGLRVESPDGAATIDDIDVVSHPAGARIESQHDIVVLAMKSQDTRRALDELCPAAPDTTPIVCLQNGVENERAASRHFANVYGVCVMCPTGHLEPGVVQAYSTPITGLLDVGCYPSGIDDVVERVVDGFRGATFSSEPRADVMRWKHTKLLKNLANAVEAICGPAARRGPLAALVHDEGVACLTAAGIAFASDAEDKERRGDLLRVQPIAGQPRGGGSSWQSLERRVGSIETDFLNGEIVLLGRVHGVPTPANALVQQLANELASNHAKPGTISEADVVSRLHDQGSDHT